MATQNFTPGAAGAAGQGQFTPGQFPQGGPPGGFAGRGGRGMLFGPLPTFVLAGLLLATLVVSAIVFYRIFKKTGRAGLLSLLMLIPGVNLLAMLWAAFSAWPVEAEVARLRTALATAAATGVAPAGVEAPAE